VPRPGRRLPRRRRRAVDHANAVVEFQVERERDDDARPLRTFGYGVVRRGARHPLRWARGEAERIGQSLVQASDLLVHLADQRVEIRLLTEADPALGAEVDQQGGGGREFVPQLGGVHDGQRARRERRRED
jgi:hypothetical protein